MILVEYSYLNHKFELNKKHFVNKKWLYLGVNYDVFLNIKNNFLQKELCVDCYEEFKKIQKENESIFLEFFGDLCEKFNSIEWWSSSISERNMFIDEPLFISICLIILGSRYSSQKDILIISDNDNIINFFKSKAQIKFLYKKNIALNIISKIKIYYKSRRRFVFESYNEQAKKKELKDFKFKKFIGLCSWVDARNFDATGNFTETYFGKIFKKFVEKDNYIFLPFFLYTYNSAEAKKLLKKNFIRYINILSYYSKIEIALSLLRNILPKKFFFAKYVFNGIDCSTVVRKYILEEYINNKFSYYYLNYYSIKRVVKTIKFERIIYLFENQPWEKLLNFVLEYYSPDTRRIGYLHSITLPYYLSMYCSKKEKIRMPLPNKILCIGKVFYNELTKYYSKDILFLNCSFRYSYLFNYQLTKKKKNQIIKILVVLSIDFSKNYEIIDKVFKAFSNNKNKYFLIIKPHPTYNFAMSDLKIDVNTCLFTVTNEKISVLLDEVDLVINPESTVGIESLKKHVPVITILFDLRINFSPIDYFPGIQFKARTSEDILKLTEEILNYSDNQLIDYFSETDKFINDCFNPIKDEYINDFLYK